MVDRQGPNSSTQLQKRLRRTQTVDHAIIWPIMVEVMKTNLSRIAKLVHSRLQVLNVQCALRKGQKQRICLVPVSLLSQSFDIVFYQRDQIVPISPLRGSHTWEQYLRPNYRRSFM